MTAYAVPSISTGRGGVRAAVWTWLGRRKVTFSPDLAICQRPLRGRHEQFCTRPRPYEHVARSELAHARACVRGRECKRQIAAAEAVWLFHCLLVEESRRWSGTVWDDFLRVGFLGWDGSYYLRGVRRKLSGRDLSMGRSFTGRQACQYGCVRGGGGEMSPKGEMERVRAATARLWV